ALQALSKTSNLRAHNVAALLRGNICNAPAMTEAVLLLNGQQMFQHSIALGTTFLKRCSSSYSIAFPVAYAMYHSSRLEDAARLLREYEPVKRDNSQYYTWRGFVDERLGRHTTAARHFLKALTLFPDLKNVHVQQFYYATRALEAAGKPCEAMHPLQMYVALEPAKRMTGQIRSILNRLRQRGRC
ncbi:MAG: hypothetical protein KDJ36_13545, partial [Hyphomicrobiaceae bacterium]|nr:hypothetical protein [Hyphomicrobiaceae bacterium]